MAYEPLTAVRLLSNVPLTPKNEHQLYFTSKTAQANYFTSKATYSRYTSTYQKEQNRMRIGEPPEHIQDCNYVMFQNNDVDPKWFYGFITEKEYINPNLTYITFEIDAWQTYQFDIDVKKSFVEREHCKLYNSDGSPVVNTQPEGLEFGTEYNVVKNEVYEGLTQDYYLLACTTSLVDAFNSGIPENPPLPDPKIIQGLLTGLDYYVLSDNDQTYNPDPLPENGDASTWGLPVSASTPISSGYGYRVHPISGEYKLHAGIDFDGVDGEAVYAVYLGKVVYAQYTAGFGNYVVVHHDSADGLAPANHFTGYAHLKSINVVKGQVAEQGQILGFMGTTGDSTGVHLHFNLADSLFGNYSNPASWLGITNPAP